jgi:tetratricopeptide (TPR) repeat protein
MADNWRHAEIEDLETKLEMCVREYDKWDPRTLEARRALGEALEDAGRFTEAELQFAKWANGYANIYGPEDPRFLKASRRFALLRIDQGLILEAEYQFRDVLEKYQRLCGPRDLEAYYTLFALGQAIILQGRFDEGVLLMEKGRDLQESILGADHMHVKGAYAGVATAIQIASTATPEKRRFMARRAMQTIHPHGAPDEKDLDTWSMIKHCTFMPGGRSWPEMAYLTEEEINQGTRFPNVLDSEAELQLERLTELINAADSQQAGFIEAGFIELINAADSQETGASDDFV